MRKKNRKNYLIPLVIILVIGGIFTFGALQQQILNRPEQVEQVDLWGSSVTLTAPVFDAFSSEDGVGPNGEIDYYSLCGDNDGITNIDNSYSVNNPVLQASAGIGGERSCESYVRIRSELPSGTLKADCTVNTGANKPAGCTSAYCQVTVGDDTKSIKSSADKYSGGVRGCTSGEYPGTRSQSFEFNVTGEENLAVDLISKNGGYGGATSRVTLTFIPSETFECSTDVDCPSGFECTSDRECEAIIIQDTVDDSDMEDNQTQGNVDDVQDDQIDTSDDDFPVLNEDDNEDGISRVPLYIGISVLTIIILGGIIVKMKKK